MPTMRGKMYAPAALRLDTNVMLRHRPISMKMSTIMIIWPRAIMFGLLVKKCNVYLQRSALIPARPNVIGRVVFNVLNTRLYASSVFPAPTRCPVIICVDIAHALENIIAKEISRSQYTFAFAESSPIMFMNERSVV